MEYNFDKEIDTLLRQVARSGQVVSTADFDAHLDADEISMFAENALPEKARNRAVKHLAECNNCRSILSNLILLNEETEIKTVSHIAEEKTVQTAAVPWHKKFFVFPQIAYATGALALVFSGVVGFLIYQTDNQNGSFEIAKSSPVMANSNASVPNADDGEAEFDANLSNSMSANTSIASNTDSDIIKMANANSFTPKMPTARIPSDEKSELNESKTKKENNPVENRPEPALKPAPVERRDNENNTAGDVSGAADLTMRQTEQLPPTALQRRGDLKKKSDKKNEEQTKLAGKTETRKQIGGKTFNRVNGVWIDSDYGQMSNLQLPMTTTIRRGTSEYLKLDKSIRIIAESLEGSVIIVSNNKAYRIQ